MPDESSDLILRPCQSLSCAHANPDTITGTGVRTGAVSMPYILRMIYHIQCCLFVEVLLSRLCSTSKEHALTRLGGAGALQTARSQRDSLQAVSGEGSAFHLSKRKR